MNQKIKKFNEYLDSIKDQDPVIEAAQTAFNAIFEQHSTEDAVANLEKRVPDKFEEPPTPEEKVEEELIDEGEISPINEAMDSSAAPQVGYYTLEQDETFTVTGDSPEKDYDVVVKAGKYALNRDAVDKQLFVMFPATIKETGKPIKYLYRVDAADADAEIVDDI